MGGYVVLQRVEESCRVLQSVAVHCRIALCCDVEETWGALVGFLKL